MKLFSDIKSKRLLILKGLLFLLVALLAGVGLLLESLRWETLLLLMIFAWSACRFYYFLFYVLERYAGRERKYAGIFDELKHLFRKK
ncbi:MAG: hypothetical protein ACSHYA_04420 [Opitutaceae bacterium]